MYFPCVTFNCLPCWKKTTLINRYGLFGAHTIKKTWMQMKEECRTFYKIIIKKIGLPISCVDVVSYHCECVFHPLLWSHFCPPKVQRVPPFLIALRITTSGRLQALNEDKNVSLVSQSDSLQNKLGVCAGRPGIADFQIGIVILVADLKERGLCGISFLKHEDLTIQKFEIWKTQDLAGSVGKSWLGKHSRFRREIY